MNMRTFVILATACMSIVAQAATADTTLPLNGNAPKEELACTAPGISQPTPIGIHTATEADYPAIAVRRGEQGNVMLAFLIHADGTVSDPIVTTSSGSPDLDAASAAVVMRWRYHAATQSGTPVACRWRAMVEWRLTDTQNIVEGDRRFLPPELRENEQQATTSFWVSVDEDGNVISMRVWISSGDPNIDAAGMRFLQSMKFTAPQMNGKPMQSAIPIDVQWSANGGKSQ
jgi:TonB family protein